MKRFFLLLMFLAACSDNNIDAVSIDPQNLPETIDVKTAVSLQDRDDVVFIDVREQWEYDEGHIPNVTLIPMSEIEQRLAEIPTDKEVIFTCRSGARSGNVLAWLTQQGYENVHNLEGGILAWQSAGYAVEQ